MGGWNRIEYKEGEMVGSCYFVRDVESHPKRRKAIFKCGLCNSEFVTQITFMRTGHTASCGCLLNRPSPQRISYIFGEKVGNCIFIEESIDGDKYHRKAVFECFCGKRFTTAIAAVKSRKTKSCGCILHTHRKTYGTQQKKHGKTGTKEYNVWFRMKERCRNPRLKEYRNYGARGIKVCDSWENSFENFISDMGKRPTAYHSIERIDNNKGYSKENCKWALREEQTMNRRVTLKVKYNGVESTLMGWCSKLGIQYHKVVSYRHKKKVTAQEAFLNFAPPTISYSFGHIK